MNPELRLMSFNIRLNHAGDGDNAWPHRKDFAGQVIRAYGPDLLGMQEVLEGQFIELQEQLPGYESFGVGRADGKRSGEFSPLFYRHDRFEVADRGTWWLSPTPDVAGSKGWDAALPRIATWMALRDRSDGGRRIHVVNTHFDHKGVEARLESAKLIVAKLAAVTDPCIVMGDINCTDDEPPIHAFTASGGGAGGFVDTFRALHPADAARHEGTFHAFAGRTDGRRIDFIFTRGFEVLAADIDRSHDGGRYPSDHFPITALVRCTV